MGISQKLHELIGDESVQSWSERHGLAKQTVHEWLKHDRMPGKNSLNMLAQATGKTTDWWLGKEDLTDSFYITHEQSRANLLKLNQHYAQLDSTKELIASEKINQYSPEQAQHQDDFNIQYFADVYAAAGAGQLTPTEQLTINIRVNAADWHRYIGLDHKHIKIINVHGDSMKPTLSHGDQVMVDTACSSFVDDAIYCIQQGDNLRFKRIKLNLDGSILVKSDNDKEGYPPELYTASQAADFNIIGKVIPFKFGFFDV